MELARSAKLGLSRSVPKLTMPRSLHLEFDEGERAVVEDDDLDRKLELAQGEEIAEHHGESAVAGERDDLTRGDRRIVRQWPAGRRRPSIRARRSRGGGGARSW